MIENFGKYSRSKIKIKIQNKVFKDFLEAVRFSLRKLARGA